MKYTKKLPMPTDILWLGRLSKPFPASRDDVIDAARRWRFKGVALDFLKQFPENAVFKTRLDFMGRCYELVNLLKQGKSTRRLNLR